MIAWDGETRTTTIETAVLKPQENILTSSDRWGQTRTDLVAVSLSTKEQCCCIKYLMECHCYCSLYFLCYFCNPYTWYLFLGDATEAAAVWAGEAEKRGGGRHFCRGHSSCQVQTSEEIRKPLLVYSPRVWHGSSHSVFHSVWVWSRRTMMLCCRRCRDLRWSWVKSDRTCRPSWDARASVSSWTHCRRRWVHCKKWKSK